MINKKIAMIGTVGIPAKYGGFETLVEYLTKELNEKFDFTVYCSSKSYEEKIKTHNNSKLKYIPFKANGIQSILYDIISLFLASKKADTILVLGVSGCIILPIYRFFYRKKKLIINIDGLEHRRKKWNKWIKRFLKLSESLAIKHANEIIADNQGILDYIESEYCCFSNLITYGANHVKKNELTKQIRQKYVLPNVYAFKVCRIEPENNIHIILDAFSKIDFSLVIIGNWENSDYGKKLYNNYKKCKNIKLLQPIYNQDILNQIRSNSNIYIHGHSAGGTNPSLVEAMALGLPIVAFNVNYNKATTFNEALYFNDSSELIDILNNMNEEKLISLSLKMIEIAKKNYTWESISEKYSKLF